MSSWEILSRLWGRRRPRGAWGTSGEGPLSLFWVAEGREEAQGVSGESPKTGGIISLQVKQDLRPSVFSPRFFALPVGFQSVQQSGIPGASPTRTPRERRVHPPSGDRLHYTFPEACTDPGRPSIEPPPSKKGDGSEPIPPQRRSGFAGSNLQAASGDIH